MVDSTVFWAFTLVYIAITMYLGYLGWKSTRNSEDFMLAGRKVHPWIIGLSYGATFISTAAIVGFGGVSAELGMGLIWLTMLNIGVGILLAFIVFGKRTREWARKLNAVTFPDLMGKRYNSSFMQYATGVMIMIAMPLYASAVLIGGSTFLSITLGINYEVALLIFAIITAVYVVLGGLIAVMYTDAMQGIIMIVGMTAFIILTYALLGGVTHANAQLASMSNLVPPDLAAQGMTGWTSMPTVGSPIWYTMVTTIILGVGIGVLAQPQLVIRFMTAKDDRTLSKAIPIGGLFILITTGVAYTVGPLSNIWFYQTTGKVAWVASNHNADQIIPLFINGSMPDLFIVVFMLVLLSAAMSTLSSIFHTLGTSAGYDVWKHLKSSRLLSKGGAPMDPKPSLTATRVGTAVMIVASVLLAFSMPTNIIARATAMFMGLCAAAFLPAFTMAMFVDKPSRTAAKLSLSVGAISWFLWTLFVHKAEATALGISKALFGSVTVWGAPYNVIDSLVVAVPLSVAALFIGWGYDKYMAEKEVKSNGRTDTAE